MAETFTLEIVTPTGVVLSEEVEEVYAPGEEGEFGVLKGHTELIGNLTIGRVHYKSRGTSGEIAITGGYAEVWPDRVNLLVDTALKADEIDLNEAKRELDEAERLLEGLSLDDPDYKKTRDTREFARAKVEVAGRR